MGNLQAHSLIHSGEKPWPCSKCPKKFTRKSTLNSHIKIMHSKERPFKCELCEKMFATKGNRDRHLNSHLNEKHHKCSSCGKRFRRLESLRYHLKAHDGIKDLKCSQCDRGYTNPSELKKHCLRKHANGSERRFECIFCAKSFATGADIERHLRGHVGEKPIFCDLCDISYSKNFNLKIHMRRIHSL